MSDYISECRVVPIEKSCSQSSWTLESVKREISEGKPLVKVLIWNHNGKIIDVLTMSNYKSELLPRSREGHSTQKLN